MNPHIIRGPLAALEARLAADVRAFRMATPLAPLTILIGSNLLRPYLRRRFAELHGGLINLRLLTVHDLAGALAFAATYANGTSPLPPMGERFIAEETAAQADGYFKDVARSPGFAEALNGLFNELRQADLDQESFDQAAGLLSQEMQPSAEKLRALATLYAQAQRRRAGFHGGDDLIRLADPSRFDGTDLLVYGIWNLTTIQREMLERLMTRVRVTFYLPDGAGNANDAHAELRAWLLHEGAAEERIAHTEASASGLARLQAGIFEPPSGVDAPADGTVRLVSAPDTSREVREAARVCLGWAREGIAFHEMAVAYRRAETYRGLVDEIFSRAGVPIYLHDGRPCIEHPAGRSLAALLSLVGSRLTRSAVMEFLTETRLPQASSERFGGFEPAAWDEISRDSGVVEGRRQWFERLDNRARILRSYVPDGEEPAERLRRQLDEIDRFRRFLEGLFDRLEDWPERDSWEGYRARLSELASEYIEEIEPILERLAELDRLRMLASDISFPRFVHTVGSALQQIDSGTLYDIQTGAFGRQGVNVIDVNSLRHLRFRAVILLGLTERAFPAPPRQDALLLDHERVALSKLIPGEIQPRATGPDPEPLQFTLALAAARERLQLSFARGDAGGTRAQLPSYFFRAAAETLTGKSVTIAEIDGLPKGIFERVPANRFGAALADESLTPGEYDRTLIGARAELGKACLLRRSHTFARACQAWDARWGTTALTAWDGVLDPDHRLAITRDARSISPTRLEAYAGCPYRYFLQSVLRLEEVEEPETIERLSALDRGSLIHEILDRFLSRYRDDLAHGRGTAGQLKAKLREIAEEASAAWERQGRGGYPLVWEFDKEAIYEDLDQWLDLELEDQRWSDLHPRAFEVRFGPSWSGERQNGNGYSVDEPLTVSFDGDTLRFHGRIDRIDWNDDRSSFRVIDYKTGRAGKDGQEQFTQGTTLQLPLYLLATTYALKEHGIDIPWENGRAEYFFSTTRGGFKRLQFSGRTLNARWDEFMQLLGDMTGQIARGDFHPEPGENAANCRFCLGKQVCDQRVVRLAERKAASREPRFLRILDVE